MNSKRQKKCVLSSEAAVLDNKIMISVDNRYMSLLRRLFKANYTGPQRHSDNDKLEFRKRFFLNLCSTSQILNRTKIIHVAGTKGKGSTVEYISAALRDGNKRKVGVFTSPHLHTARERIRIGSTLISKEDLTRIGENTLKQLADSTWAVFFDHFLTLAMQYFAEKEVDYIVFETGIGGRYDSTNFIEKSQVSVITSISFDHQNLLGNTIEAIASQKAGIIKHNGHVFISENQHPLAIPVIKKECEKMKATLHIIPVDRFVDNIKNRISMS